jgi:hypothetical protein
VCKGFDTSINHKHNLARCFQCRQNFNPIELVMHQRRISFVDSVKWLKRHNGEAESDNASTRRIQPPTNIGDILPQLLPASPRKQTSNPTLETIMQRILNLERQVSKLSRLIEELHSSAYQR